MTFSLPLSPRRPWVSAEGHGIVFKEKPAASDCWAGRQSAACLERATWCGRDERRRSGVQQQPGGRHGPGPAQPGLRLPPEMRQRDLLASAGGAAEVSRLGWGWS